MPLKQEKLWIIGRTNWEKGCYIKFRASKKSIQSIKKIIGDFGSKYFVDSFGVLKTLSDYNKWKDQWIPICSKNLIADIICGDKVIHMIVYKCPSFESVNKVLDKHCKWVKIKR